jgi:hypothetical protein
VIRGLALPDDVLKKIYRENFVRLVSADPNALNVAGAIKTGERIATIAGAMTGKPASETEAARVAEALS